jgi:hypothetical protein
VFVIDPVKEHIAVVEANRLKIPVVAVADTNADPRLIQYVIPGNDDAIRAIKLFCSRIADACLEGAKLGKARAVNDPGEGRDPEPIRVTTGGDGPRVEIVSRRTQLPQPEAAASPEEDVRPDLRQRGLDHGIRHQRHDQRAPRADRRGPPGLQEGAHRDRRRHGQGRSSSCARRASPTPPRRPVAGDRGRGHLVRAQQQPHRRAARGQLRDGLRRADRGLQAVLRRRGHADRGDEPGRRAPRGPGHRQDRGSERALLREKALAEGKPEKMVDRIVDGQIGKFYSEHCCSSRSS